MKKLLVLVLALMMSLSFACAEEETPAFTPTDSNVLVACFSATGNTWPVSYTHLEVHLFRDWPPSQLSILWQSLEVLKR